MGRPRAGERAEVRTGTDRWPGRSCSRIPPEAAAPSAQQLLGLPLRVGAAGWRRPRPRAPSHARRDRARESPSALAAGFDKAGRHVDALGRLGFRLRGVRDVHAPIPAVATPSRGSSGIRTGARWSTPWDCRTRVRRLPPEPSAGTTPRGPRVGEHRRPRPARRARDPRAAGAASSDAVELNASCPNVAWGRDRDNETHLANLVRELGARRTRPLFVKLPPFRTEVEREVVLALAAIARQEGADALTVSNTLPVLDAHLSVGRGGLSGRAVREGTLSCVRVVREAMGPGCRSTRVRGILTPADAFAAIEAGGDHGAGVRGAGLRRSGDGGGAHDGAGRGASEPPDRPLRARRDRLSRTAVWLARGPVPVQDDAIPNGTEHLEVGLTQRATRADQAPAGGRARPRSPSSRSSSGSATWSPSTASTSTSATGSSSRCSVPPGPGRRPACG